MTPEENNGYVPRIERDLAKAGGDMSALRKNFEPDMSVPGAREDFSMDEEPEQAPESEQEQEPEAPVLTEEDIEYVYGEDDSYDYTGKLEDIPAENIALEEMDVKTEEMRTDKSSMISSIKNQLQADDLAMSVTERPTLDEMSEEYSPTKKKAADIMSKDTLDKDEKEMLRNRMREQIESKPEGYDKKKSAAMYKKLMEEQKGKAAKHGFLVVAINAVLGLITAAVMYFIGPGDGGGVPLMDYLPVAAVIFSLFMLIRSKFSKILSCVYFAANTILLIYPGLVSYATNEDNLADGSDFVVKLILYVVAILLSGLTCVRLAMNKSMEDYYSYKPKR